MWSRGNSDRSSDSSSTPEVKPKSSPDLSPSPGPVPITTTATSRATKQPADGDVTVKAEADQWTEGEDEHDLGEDACSLS